MKKVLFGKKTAFVVLLALLMVCSAFVTPVSASPNGKRFLKANDVTLGLGDLWTSPNLTGYFRISGETEAYQTQNAVAVGVGYSYMDMITYTYGEERITAMSVERNATLAHDEKDIDKNTRAPIDVWGRFGINTTVGGICYKYNSGQGLQACEHVVKGDDCPNTY